MHPASNPSHEPLWQRTVYSLLLIVTALPFIFPLAWLLLMSLQPSPHLYSARQPLSLANLTLANYLQAWELLDLPRMFRNSLMISLLSTAGCVLSSSLAGFAFAFLPYSGSRLLFGVTLSTIMVPAGSTLIPLFAFFSYLGWVNTFLPVILPFALGNAFYVFLFRQYFRTLPLELFHSAELDGCNPLTAYLYIAIPLARPALAAVAIFAFLASWNDFLNPLIYLHSPELHTLSVGLASFQGFYFTQIHYLLPISVLSILPLLLVFGFAQRFLVQGITAYGWSP